MGQVFIRHIAGDFYGGLKSADDKERYDLVEGAFHIELEQFYGRRHDCKEGEENVI